jgi:hypothetical protein
MCEDECHSRYIFLTLTVKNVPWAELASQIRIIMKSWDRMNHRLKRATVVTGWVRTFEVTRSKKYGDAHPHLHVLLQVPPEYFNKKSDKYLFHKKDELIKQWKDCLQAEYDPSVSIKAVKDVGYAIGKAVAETTKYIAKGSDIDGLGDKDFKSYIEAMSGVRCWSTGGRMRIPEEDIEAYLHGDEDEMTHPEGICGNCGDKLYEMREVWDAEAGVYHVSIDVEFYANRVNNLFSPINLNINTMGGDMYVGCKIGREPVDRETAYETTYVVRKRAARSRVGG